MFYFPPAQLILTSILSAGKTAIYSTFSLFMKKQGKKLGRKSALERQMFTVANLPTNFVDKPYHKEVEIFFILAMVE
jgi:hypothetical protein